MRALGYLLITLGFLAGSLLATKTKENVVDWLWFVPTLIVGVVGVVLARAGARGVARQEGAVSAHVDSLHSSIERIVANVQLLDGEKGGLHPYEVHGRIDELFIEDITLFVDARQSIGHQYGLQAYAAVMNEFAAGERYLNRVWSASVDCYIDEVHAYLPRARQQFETTRDLLKSLQAAR